MRLVIAATLMACATSVQATSFLSRSGTGAAAGSCPSAPLTGECPTVPRTLPPVQIGTYPSVQDWKITQPGFDSMSVVDVSTTGYGGAFAFVQPDNFTSLLSAALGAYAYTNKDDSGRYAVSYASAAALYAYSYSGLTAVELPLVGDINYTVEFAPLSEALYYSYGSASMRMVVGTSNFYKGTTLWEEDSICGAADVLAAGYATGGAGGFASGFATQSFQYQLDLTLGCDGQPLMINPGQSIYVFTFLDVYAQRGAWTDASHSFHVNLAPGTPPATATALKSGLRLVSDVPEPKSWVLMIAGYGIIGGAMRRARDTSQKLLVV